MSNPESAAGIQGKKPIHRYLDRADLKEFIKAQSKNAEDNYLISFSFPVPALDPLAGLEILSEENEYNFYWEKPDRNFALSAGGEVKSFRNAGADRFKDTGRAVVALKKSSASYSMIDHSLTGIHLLGGFSFFDQIHSQEWEAFGSAALTVPDWLLFRDGKFGLLTITLEKETGDDQNRLTEKLKNIFRRFVKLYQLDEEVNFESHIAPSASDVSEYKNLPDNRWIDNVENAKELIQKKTFDKIVLAREVEWESESAIAPTHVINTLRNQYPTCYSFLVKNTEGTTFIGCSPERLVSFHKTYLLTESLAGSISRGKTATEDLYLEKRLLGSRKNRNEHQIVIRAIEKRLHPFVQDIDRGRTPDIKKLKNVQHLYTPIRAGLKKNFDRFSILEQLHPTPAVGGYPRQKAVPYINKLESFDRGWYAGPVGWFNLNGGGEFSVAIRSSLINKNRARIFAGCGIVEDSDPYAEWEETNLKLMPMLSAFIHDKVRQAE